jgi:kynurenine formamidase
MEVMCPPGTVEQVRAACSHNSAGDSSHHHISRRALLSAGGVAAVASLLPGKAANAADAAQQNGHLQDLTYIFSPTFPIATGPAPTRSTLFTIEEDGFYAQQWSFWEHTATHLDAPGHFIPGGRLAPQLDPSELMFVPAAVIDISARAARNPDSKVEVADLRAYESRYGRIPDRALVIMNSGWQSRVNDPDAFLGRDTSGTLHYPGFSADAAEFLLEHRHIGGVAVDTISIDAAASNGAPVHHMVLGADLYALENLANLARIPCTGAQLFVGVVPWEQGSGGPCRVVAQV